MANRSYLYTSEHLPGSPESEKDRDLHSIAEWNYDIPLVFKLLLTGNPIAVESSIWEVSEKIAVAGEFESGLKALALNLEEDNVGAVLLGDSRQVKEGDTVKRTKQIASIKAGEGVVGIYGVVGEGGHDVFVCVI